MTATEPFRRLHQHRAWVNRNLLAAAVTLTDEQRKAELPIGQGSIWKSLLHLYGAEYAWFECLLGNEGAVVPRDLPGKLPGSDEARLVNLWIALEALCQGGEGSVIERVWTRIAPCVSIDNVRRTLVSLSIFLRKLWTADNTAEFSALFPNSSRERLEPDDLASLLILPPKHEHLKALSKLCLKHPLILHRLSGYAVAPSARA